MKTIELKRVVISRTTQTKVFSLVDGLELFYYGNNYGWEDRPKKGVVKEKDGIFTIHWEDGQDSTEINESEKSISIIKHCGF